MIQKKSIIKGKGQKLYEKAKKIIPAGTQLLSKRPELHLPDFWPSYYSKAKGCEVWDLDNNKYIDMSYMGIGACVLGYADNDIDKSVKRAIDFGVASTLNAPEEVELANIMLRLHPWAKMVRFSKTGGEAMAIAVRIARAYSGKDIVLFCGYHGWHDWYLASNLADNKSLDGHLIPGLEPNGVPRPLINTSIPFHYNDIHEFNRLFEKNKKELAAVVMEPLRDHLPEKGFLETIRIKTKLSNIPLIMDEVSAGFRIIPGGAHKVFNIKPDIAVFSKALGNGYPIAAIIGTEKVMQAAQTSFISSTNWTERTGLAAAIAVTNKFSKFKVHHHLMKKAKDIQVGLRQLSIKNKLDIDVSGVPPFAHFNFKHNEPLILKTLFTQLMLERGFLATTAYYASFAHKDIHIKKYLDTVNEVFAIISKSISDNNYQKLLIGKVCQTGFKRLT